MNRGHAYLASVAIAAATMEASFNVMGGTGPIDARIMPILAIAWLVAFTLIAFATFIPALAVVAFLDRYAKWYLGVCVAAALTTAALFTLLGAEWMTDPDGDPDRLTFAQALPRYSCWVLPAALVGALAFWHFAYRNGPELSS